MPPRLVASPRWASPASETPTSCKLATQGREHASGCGLAAYELTAAKLKKPCTLALALDRFAYDARLW
jgi:hypothetical protein